MGQRLSGKVGQEMNPYYSLRFAGALVCAGVLHSSASDAATERVIYRFCSLANCADGANAYAGLVYGGGRLYGTTFYGGTGICKFGDAGCGTVYSVDPKTRTESVLYSFATVAQKLPTPYANLIKVGSTLYGTTFYSGAYNYGKVFSVTLSGSEATVYSFGGNTSSAIGPAAGLIDVGGTLYGTTVDGGGGVGCRRREFGCGTVFSVTPNGTEKVLYAFNNSTTNGVFPEAGLINVNGMLYGTTSGGGGSGCTGVGDGCGTVFSVNPTTGTETVLHSFVGGNDGWYPEASLVDVGGILYGTTGGGGGTGCGGYGCGIVFSVNPQTGAETVVYSFQGGSDATGGSSLINIGGTLYGTGAGGGGTGCGGYGCGTVFSVTPGGTETVIYSFQAGSDGAIPDSGLIDVNGTLYGTTLGGGGHGRICGVTRGCGTVFSIKL
jgi:uncharacterized repeat protein (TIGR03803 family)